MRAVSNIKPEGLTIEKCGKLAEMIFCENIEEIQRDGEVLYSYDEYRTAVQYRENLSEIVEKSYSEWLARAKSEEKSADKQEKTLEEQIAELTEQNAKLSAENEIISAALEETIAMVLGEE